MNVISYFLIVLGGFGVIWGFRWVKYRGKSKKEISEFEYAALSAIWGSLLLYCLIFVRNFLQWPSENKIDTYMQAPFVISPTIAFIGFVVGAGVAYFLKRIGK